jgi:N-methylhydantoinase B
MTPDRMVCPAPGFAGGKAGTPVRVTVNGEVPALNSEFFTAGYLTLHDDSEQLVWDFAGGGGWGNPQERDAEATRRDVELGIVTPDK